MIRLLSLLFVASLFFNCGGPEGTKVESGEAMDAAPDAAADTVQSVAWNVLQDESVVNWEGTKLVGGGHEGIIPVTFGQIVTSGNRLVAGRFTMNMKDIQNTDLDEEGAGQLVGHLKSPDFFDVENHPVATFDIVNTKQLEGDPNGNTHEITGNLALHGKSRSVTIPAKIAVDGDRLTATTPDFVIDRKEWDIVYGSGSLGGLAQDKIINDNVGLQLNLVANKE